MSVIRLDFYDEDSPNGTSLGSLDESDLKAISFRPALYELGALSFTINRHRTAATSTLIHENNFVKVVIPSVSADPISVFMLKNGKFTLIDKQGQQDENLTFGGPDARYLLGLARLYPESKVSDQPARGSLDVPGMWTWVNEPYGAILTRIIEEGRWAPFPDAAGAGAPLSDVTIDFDRVNDSDGNAWPTITETFQTPIGSSVMDVAQRLAQAGDIFLVMDPDLTLHAHQTSPGRDLSGAFGTDTVRFQAGVNILNQLTRDIAAREVLTHLILTDADGNSSSEVSADYVSGRAHVGAIEFRQTNDDSLLNSMAQNAIAASQTAGEQLELEITPGFDPASGRYMPGFAGTNGHFWVGDLVTVHTGTSDFDYNAATQEVVALRVELREAASDATSDTAARSLHIVPELNYRTVRGFSADGASPAALGQPGYCCGPKPAQDTCTDVTADFAPDNFDCDVPISTGSHWYQGGVDTNDGAAGYYSFHSLANPFAGYSFSGTWVAGTKYTVRIRTLLQAGAAPATITLGYASAGGNPATFSADKVTVTISGAEDWTYRDIEWTPSSTYVSDGLYTNAGVKIDLHFAASTNAGILFDGESVCEGSTAPIGIGGPGEGETGTGGTYIPGGTVIEHGDLSGKGGTMHDASQIEFTPNGSIAATNVQAAIQEVRDEATGVTDHGALTGLLDDDHTQYQKESEKGAASGYASLDGSTKVPFAQLPTGTSSSTVAVGNHTHAGGVTEADVRDAGRWEPVTNGDSVSPEIVFEAGDVVMEWVTGP